MEKNQITEKVKNLILEGKLDDAAEQLISFFDNKVIDESNKDKFQLYNQAIHQLSQLNEIKNAQLSGIIESDDVNIRRNKIRKALLEINTRIKFLDSKVDLESSNVEGRIENVRTRNKSKFILWGIPLLLLGIAIGYYALNGISGTTKKEGTAQITPSEKVGKKDQTSTSDSNKKDVGKDETSTNNSNDVNRRPAPDKKALEEAAARQRELERLARITKLTIQPDINGMGTSKGYSGSLGSGPYSPFSPPSFGDNKAGK